MLSRTSRQEILRRLSQEVGYPVEEDKLSPNTRKAITNLADFQRRLITISEMLNGERGRVEQSVLLTFSSRFHKDKEIEAHTVEIAELQKELDIKMSEISSQIVREAEARESGKPLPDRGEGLEFVMLKCPTCGAALPLPTGRYVKCEYCDSTFSIQDVSSQMRDMIQKI